LRLEKISLAMTASPIYGYKDDMLAYIDPEYARIKKRTDLFLYTFLVLVFCAFLLVSWLQIKEKNALEHQIALATHERNQVVETIENELLNATEENVRLEKYYEVCLKKLRNSSVFLSSVLSALEDAVGEQIVISKFVIDNNNLICEGLSSDIPSIQYFYTLLSKQRWSYSAAITRIDRIKASDHRKYFFIIEVEIQHD
jgi:hypothetical protein